MNSCILPTVYRTSPSLFTAADSDSATHVSLWTCRQKKSSFHSWHQPCVAQQTQARLRVLTDNATVVVTLKKKCHHQRLPCRLMQTLCLQTLPFYSCGGRQRLACTVSSRAMWPACVTYFCGPPPWQLATKEPLSRGSEEGLWWVICIRL